MSIVLYPGSFDPLHNGHLEIIETASRLFDRVIVAAMVNREKSGFFELDDRRAMLIDSLAHLANVQVAIEQGLVIDAVRTLGADLIVKGLRTAGDFEGELQMAQMNKNMGDVDTVFLPSGGALGFLSSRYIREMAKEGRDVSHLVPGPVAEQLRKRQ